MSEYFLEDFEVGQTFETGSQTLTEDDIKAFAAQFDPQPFHLDNEAAQATLFKGLAASGWHTAAITMRLMVDGPYRPVGGMIGAGVEEIRWSKPVRPGDTLSVKSEVVDVRKSRSNPSRGIVRMLSKTLNQNGEVVQEFTANMVSVCQDV